MRHPTTFIINNIGGHSNTASTERTAPVLPTCVWIWVTTVFQNRANKQRHQTNPIHQRTRRTVNIPQRVLRIHLYRVCTDPEINLVPAVMLIVGCKCVTCMLKSGPPLWCCPLCSPGNCRGEKARLQPAEPKTTCYDEGTSVVYMTGMQNVLG